MNSRALPSPGLRILVVNAGSSSVKLRLVDGADRLAASEDLGPPDLHLADHLERFASTVGPFDAVGHRVVHGGPGFTSATVIDQRVEHVLASLRALAPLHNPPALSGIDAARRLFRDVPSVACFDTAFHARLPAAAYAYALPAEWVTRWQIRRYGFHGLSCAWATGQAGKLLDRPADSCRLVVCHLGGGASVTAVTGGRSADTTMGFTPLEGLVMATRCGDVDPGFVLWALEHGLSRSDVEDGLEHRSGLLGLSGGRSGDMRELLALRASGDAVAEQAVGVYLHRLRAKIAAMAAATGGTDAVVFTGGVGEHSAVIRAETAAGLDWIGVAVDAGANAAVADADADISAPCASVRTLVVHAREDLQIAHECHRLLQGPSLAMTALTP